LHVLFVGQGTNTSFRIVANTILGCDDAEVPNKKPWNISFQGFDDRYTRQLRHALVVFFHPDFNRWLWISTRSALLLQGSRALHSAVASFALPPVRNFASP
jgi:hypothetical protein